jgi:hypothetical protein
VSSGRTVCEPTTDRPRGTGEQSEKDSQISSTAPTITDCLWRHLGQSATNTLLADCPRTPGGPSAKLPTTEGRWENESKKARKNKRRTRRTPSQPTPRGPFPAYRGTVRQEQTEQPKLQTASTTSPTRPWISQTA